MFNKGGGDLEHSILTLLSQIYIWTSCETFAHSNARCWCWPCFFSLTSSLFNDQSRKKSTAISFPPSYLSTTITNNLFLSPKAANYWQTSWAVICRAEDPHTAWPCPPPTPPSETASLSLPSILLFTFFSHWWMSLLSFNLTPSSPPSLSLDPRSCNDLHTASTMRRWGEKSQS